MAFQYYTIETIRNIDVNNIPDSFVSYYNSLAETMKAEVREIRPDLALAVEGFSGAAEAASETSTESETDIREDGRAKIARADELTEPEAGDPIIEAWESVSYKKWLATNVEVPVLVCKMMPDYNRICRIHRVPLQQRNLKFRNNGRVTGAITFFCPECMSVFIEQKDVVDTVQRLAQFGIPIWMQPLEETVSEWKEYGKPNAIGEDDVIYIPKTWHDGQNTCPLHPDTHILEDDYQKTYADKTVTFGAFYCPDCKKIIMRNTAAQRLEEELAEKGIPAIEYKPLREEKKKQVSFKKAPQRPQYFVTNGEAIEYDLGDQISWTELSEQDIVVIGFSRVCAEGHDAEETLCLLKVLEKQSGSLVNYLVIMGYCEECERYYIDKEDFDKLYSIGRPEVQTIDETNGEYRITSGSAFDAEREHLSEVEKQLDERIRGIQGSANYVGKYATLSYGYDDGGLHDAKARNRGNYEEIASISKHKGKPYEYRADITLNDATKTYYLGIDDVSLDKHTSIISFRSDLGRKLVNYRNLDVTVDRKKHHVKLRRNFEIENASLFGYTEQSDEDALFQSGITDQFLIRVLNMRKKQHQLLDIISTIQANQNRIVDHPLKENVIVQGCAGSGKTMILLHRLSILKYNNPSFDFSQSVILTPNSNFNTHIEGLAASLQLGYIHRVSVEEYYKELLALYDGSFKTSRKSRDEMELSQPYVDYLYSKEFLACLESAYTDVAEELESLCRRAMVLGEQFGKPLDLAKRGADCELIPWLSSQLKLMESTAREAESDYQRSRKQYNTTEQRFEFLTEKIVDSEKALQSTVIEQLRKMQQELVKAMQERLLQKAELEKKQHDAEIEDRAIRGIEFQSRSLQMIDPEGDDEDAALWKQVQTDFSEDMKNRSQKLLDLDSAVEAAREEYNRIDRAFLITRKRQKLADAKERIDQLAAQRNSEEIDFFNAKKQQKLDAIRRRIKQMAEKNEALQTELETIESLRLDEVEQLQSDDAKQYIHSLAPYVKDVQTPVRVINQQVKNLNDYSNELEQMPELRQKCKAEMETAEGKRIAASSQEALAKLQTAVDQTTARSLYNKCFKTAEKLAEPTLRERGIDNVKREAGNEYRFDLFLQLFFARRFFGKTVGSSSLICIDEGQDLTPSEYELIRDMNGGKPIFNVFGDTDQLLKTGRGISNWDQVDAVIGGSARYQLLENYRNTNQITDYCNRSFNMHMTLTGVDGRNVKEIIRSRLEPAISELKADNERVAVILPRCVKKETYLDRTQLPTAVRSRLGDAIEKGGISVVYVDEVKGIEFDRVFVVPNGMSQNEKYIAFTRALSDLTVVEDDELDEGEYTDAQELLTIEEPRTENNEDSENPIFSTNVRIGKIRAGSVRPHDSREM